MCGPQQPVTMTSLHVYKTPSGTYALNTEDMECTKIATFIDAGQHLPTVLTSLTLLEDNTISEPLDIILATIHAQLAADLQEKWSEFLTPCHKDSASNATQIKKTLKTKLGKIESKQVLSPFRERILSRRGQATRLFVNPRGQTVALRTTLPSTLPIVKG